MLEQLKDLNLIDFQILLLLKHKELNISEKELVALQLIIFLQKNKQMNITPELLKNYMHDSVEIIDSVLVGLVNRKLIRLQGTVLILDNLYKKLLKDENFEEKKEFDINLIDLFEKELGRTFSYIEIDTIINWQKQYGNDKVIHALRQAVIAGVHSLRYMEKILVSPNFVDKNLDESQKSNVTYTPYNWWDSDE